MAPSFSQSYLAAKYLHKGQFRRDGKTPYFNHVNRVSLVVSCKTDDEVTKCASILHDTLEDCADEAHQTFEDYGITESVISLVEILTHDPSETYLDYIKRVAKDPRAKLIKMADIFDNLTDNPTQGQVSKYLAALEILTKPIDENEIPF